MYQHQIQHQSLHIFLLFHQHSPPSCTSALLKKYPLSSGHFNKQIQPSISPKYSTYKLLHCGTPPDLHITKHILYFILTKSLWVAHPRTLSHTGLPQFLLQKYNTPIIPYQITSFIIYNFHHAKPHPIFSQSSISYRAHTHALQKHHTSRKLCNNISQQCNPYVLRTCRHIKPVRLSLSEIPQVVSPSLLLKTLLLLLNSDLLTCMHLYLYKYDATYFVIIWTRTYSSTILTSNVKTVNSPSSMLLL